MKKEIITRVAKIWESDDGSGRATFLPEAVVTLDDAKEYFTACLKVSGGKKECILVDISKVKFVEREAREYFARSKEAIKITKAVAILIKTPISRVIGSFYIYLNASALRFPVKLFSSKNKALEWLSKF
ncbi:MAG: hypothetical protein ABIG60_02260 [Patescibacteria group bacterium]